MIDLSSRAHWSEYTPANIGWGGRYDPTLHRDLLVPFRHSGASFGLMHRLVVPLFDAYYDQLVPHIIGGIAGDNDEGCFNDRSKRTGGGRSFHFYGIATDTNWEHNPMYQKRRPTGRYAMPPIASKIGRPLGIQWAGEWTYPQDWMHSEVHVTPADCLLFAGHVADVQEEGWADMPVIVVVQKTADMKRGKQKWPGWFLTDGFRLQHISSSARLHALRALGFKSKSISYKDYRGLGGK